MNYPINPFAFIRMLLQNTQGNIYTYEVTGLLDFIILISTKKIKS